MTQLSLDEASAQQFMLFDLSSPEVAAATGPVLLPQLPDTPPTRGKEKRQKSGGPARSSQRSGGQAPAAVATPKRLEIAPRAPLPEIPPLMLAGVRAALFQVLFQEALSTYQALLAQQPAAQRDQLVLAVEPARLGAAAQLLLDAPTLSAAVSLLALGAFLKRPSSQER